MIWPTAEEIAIALGTLSTETTDPVESGSVALAEEAKRWDAIVAARDEANGVLPPAQTEQAAA